MKENKICFPKGLWLIKILDSEYVIKTGQANTQLVSTETRLNLSLSPTYQ